MNQPPGKSLRMFPQYLFGLPRVHHLQNASFSSTQCPISRMREQILRRVPYALHIPLHHDMILPDGDHTRTCVFNFKTRFSWWGLPTHYVGSQCFPAEVGHINLTFIVNCCQQTWPYMSRKHLCRENFGYSDSDSEGLEKVSQYQIFKVPFWDKNCRCWRLSLPGVTVTKVRCTQCVVRYSTTTDADCRAWWLDRLELYFCQTSDGFSFGWVNWRTNVRRREQVTQRPMMDQS